MNHSGFILPSTEFYYFSFINLSYCANIAPGSLHFSPNIVVVLEADWEKVKVQCTLIRTSGDITVYHRMPACVWTVGRTWTTQRETCEGASQSGPRDRIKM